MIDECLQIQSVKGPTTCHVLTAIYKHMSSQVPYFTTKNNMWNSCHVIDNQLKHVSMCT